MPIAGTSAWAEARRLRSRAGELRRQAADDEQRAGRFEAAERTEAGTARVLAPLAGISYHLLAGRRWPGSKHAQVDMIVIGSAGVFIVDTKAWRVVSVHAGRIRLEQKDHEILMHTGIPRQRMDEFLELLERRATLGASSVSVLRLSSLPLS